MKARVAAKLRVEGEGDLVLVAHGDDVAVDAREHVDFWRGLLDEGRADEAHGEGAEALDFPRRREAAELAAVGVSDSGNIHCGKMYPLVVFDFLCQQQKPGTGAENRQTAVNQCLYLIEQIKLTQELSLYGAFAAGDDKPVKILF